MPFISRPRCATRSTRAAVDEAPATQCRHGGRGGEREKRNHLAREGPANERVRKAPLEKHSAGEDEREREKRDAGDGRPGERPARPLPQDPLRAESGEGGKPECGEEDEAVVQREREEGQPRQEVDQAGRARAEEPPGDDEPEEDRAARLLAGLPFAKDFDAREREENGAGVRERHPGAVLPLRLDGALPVDAVRERQRGGKEPARRLPRFDRLGGVARGDGPAARPVLGGVLDRLENRQELRAREREPEQGREQRSAEGSRPPPPCPAEELPRESRQRPPRPRGRSSRDVPPKTRGERPRP